MDPQAALVEARQMISHQGEREDAAERLIAYFNWRLKGGFQPPNGDERFEQLLLDLGRVADVLSAALCDE